MKVSMEIEKDTFKFTVVVGKSEHHGEQPLTPHELHLFSMVIRACERYYPNEKARED